MNVMATFCRAHRRATVGIWLYAVFTGCGAPDTPEEQAVAHFERLGGRVVRNNEGRVSQLYLSGTPVTDEDLARVVHLTELRHLEVSSTRVTDDGIVHLKELSTLGSVDVSFTGVTEQGVRQLKRDHPKLRISYSDRNRYLRTLDPIERR